jgi:TRAP-type C4-dicarboxylate transport system substrate-binding protein
VSKVFFDRLPADLKKTVLDTGSKIEPQIEQWQIARIAADAKSWAEKGGKTVKLSPEEQKEAERRVSASAASVVGKSAPLKELYEKLKSAAAAVN